MIKEKASPALNDVYHSTGIVVPAEGEENSAPDSTFTPKSAITGGVGAVPGGASASAGTGKSAKATSIPDQATGETSTSTDGTTTPSDMIHPTAKASSSSSSTSDTASATSLPPPTPRHPSLLLTWNQVPLLAKTFDLHPAELIDINRAVQQAESRLRKLDEAGNQHKSEEELKVAAKQRPTNWKGNLHR
jgi:hypothetical protein